MLNRFERLLALAPVLAAAGVLTVFVHTPAMAAVRLCRTPVVSDVVAAPSELLGKQMALRSWGAKASRAHGADYANWRIANKRILGCRPARDGSAPLACVAYAAPCKVEQAPGAPAPKKRVRPRPGTPYEI
jgi:hypothetical protein